MSAPELLILGCWLAFLAIWAVAAIGRKGSVERSGSLAGTLSYWLPLAIGAGLILKGFSHTPYPGRLGDILLPPTATSGWIGFVVTLFGLGVAIWARRSLGRNWSVSVAVKDAHELVTTGAYAFVRHPIYTGFQLMFLGSAIALGTRAAFLGFVLTLFSTWLKLRQEEALMLATFPDRYPDYVRRTKRLIPFIW